MTDKLGTASGLAKFGGPPVRSHPMPPRLAFGADAKTIVSEVIDYYAGLGLDPGYQGVYEEKYCKLFAEMHGGGFADSVATGSLAVYLAIASLDIPKGSGVVVSPITDPGTLGAIIFCGLRPIIGDAQPDSYNMCIQDAIQKSEATSARAILYVHTAGAPQDLDQLELFCKANGTFLIEDCSQAHGARVNGKLVGTFGDVAAFSTMYRKNSISGGCGGIVFTRDEKIFRMATALADRGKPRWESNFDDRDPNTFLFPALNLHNDELSCALGISSLQRLEKTNAQRRNFLFSLIAEFDDRKLPVEVAAFPCGSAPFYIPIFFRNFFGGRLEKVEIADAIRAEGIPLNSHYNYLAADWPWLRDHIHPKSCSNQASANINKSFCLYLNEFYRDAELQDVLNAIDKVFKYYSEKKPQLWKSDAGMILASDRGKT